MALKAAIRNLIVPIRFISPPNFYQNPSAGFCSNPCSIDNPPLSGNWVAGQLFDQFSMSPELRDSSALSNLGRRLTSDTVESVLKDLKGWKSAQEFFQWCALQEGFRHTCYTYNAMASRLSSSFQSSQLRSLVLDLIHCRCTMTPGALGFLIRCLGNQGLIEEANHLFERAGDLNCVPNTYTCNCLIEVLAKNGRVGMVEKRFEGVLEPDKYTLTSVLQSYCNSGKMEAAFDVFEKIKTSGWADEYVFTVLAVACSKQGKPETACDLVEQMESFGLKPSEKTFNVLIHGFLRQGRVEKALEMFQKMKVTGLRVELALFSALIIGLCNKNMFNRALEIYIEMKGNGISPDIELLKGMISSFCAKGELFFANRLLEEEEEKLNLSGLLKLFNAFIDGLVRNGAVERAHALLKTVMRSQEPPVSEKTASYEISCNDEQVDLRFWIEKPIRPNAESFGFVISGFCNVEKLDSSLVLLDEMISFGCKGNIRIYNDLICGLCKMDRLDEGGSILKKMIEFEFVPTEFTYNSLFYGLCNRANLTGALDLLKEMRRLGNNPWIKNCTLMVQQLCKQGKSEEASNFLQDMVEIGFLPNMIVYSATIDGMCRAFDINNALKLFRGSSSFYKFDVVAHNIMINGFSKAGRLVEAEGLLKEMENKGLVPSFRTYNTIIDGWCKVDRVDKAIACYEQMIEESKRPTEVSSTSLIDGYLNSGKVEDALRVWNRMKETGCLANKITYTALVHGLCKCGAIEDAILYFVEMKDTGFKPDVYVYLLLINSLIFNGRSSKAFELLNEVLEKAFEFPSADCKISRLLKRAVKMLFQDPSTSVEMKKLIEGGRIPWVKSVRDF